MSDKSTNITFVAEMITMSKKCGDAKQAQTYHNFLKDDCLAWETLDLLGFQEYDDEFKLELKNCTRCGSTLAKKVSI